MKSMKQILSITLLGSFLLAGSVLAAPEAKTYQVTGPVLEVSDTMIVVQKGDDKWQVARSKETKVTGDLKVGAKVTIEYRMVATTVDAKAAKDKVKK